MFMYVFIYFIYILRFSPLCVCVWGGNNEAFMVFLSSINGFNLMDSNKSLDHSPTL